MKPQMIILQMAANVVAEIVKLSKKSLTLFERRSAQRFACDFVRLMLQPERPAAGQRVAVMGDVVHFPPGPQDLLFSNRADFDAFARIVDAAGLTSQWTVLDPYSVLRITGKLLNYFEKEQRQCGGLIPDSGLRAIIAPSGPLAFGTSASRQLQAALAIGLRDLTLTMDDQVASASILLNSVGSHLGSPNLPEFSLTFMHLRHDSVSFVMADGTRHEQKVTRTTFQRLVMNAGAQGWLSVDQLTSGWTTVGVGRAMTDMVRSAIRRSVCPRTLLAAYVDTEESVKSASGVTSGAA